MTTFATWINTDFEAENGHSYHLEGYGQTSGIMRSGVFKARETDIRGIFVFDNGKKLSVKKLPKEVDYHIRWLLRKSWYYDRVEKISD